MHVLDIQYISRGAQGRFLPHATDRMIERHDRQQTTTTTILLESIVVSIRLFHTQ